MKKYLILLALLLMLVTPALAQEDLGPGEGAPIIEGNSTGSINIGSLNPLRCLATDCQAVNAFMYPTLVGVDPETAYYAPNAPGGLAESWTVSDDGLEYIFTLRQDVFWTDGTPVTANDVVFSINAILSDQIESTLTANIIDVVTGAEAIDDYTVKVTFAEASCTALGDASVPIVPSHVFTDFVSMVDNEFDRNPTVTSGVFSFLGVEPGERIALVANQNYTWAPNAVIPQGYLFADVPSDPVMIERFLAGELNYVGGVPVESRRQIRDSGVQYAEYPANSWNYIGLNLADPTNPQDALDAEGNRIEQGNHPLFGDVRVRRALQHAIDVQGLIEGAMFGDGVQMASYELPTSWALDPDLAPVPYDVAMAQQLLAEAGFELNEDGVLVATEAAEYAEPGTPFAFELIIDDSTETASRIGTLVQDMLLELGIEVEVVPLDFNTAIDRIGGQGYDAYLLGWSNSFPVDPDFSAIFSAEADVVGFGFNDTSYYNEEVFNLMETARVLPGCDQAERSEMYHEIQRILQEDQPYLWLFTSQVMVAAAPDIANFAPLPQQPQWNIHEWARNP